MDLHRIIVFSHVAAMIGLFAALVIEWVSVARLRQSTSYEQAREWAGLWRLLVPVGAPSIVTVLASGIYLATTLGAWEVGWVRAAVPTLIVIAIAGAVAAPHRKRIRAAIEARSGPMPREVLTQLRHPFSSLQRREQRSDNHFAMIRAKGLGPTNGGHEDTSSVHAAPKRQDNLGRDCCCPKGS